MKSVATSGNTIFSADESGVIAVFQEANNKLQPVDMTNTREGIRSIAVSGDGARLVALRNDPRLVVLRPIPSPSGPSEDLEPPNRFVVAGLKRKL